MLKKVSGNYIEDGRAVDRKTLWSRSPGRPVRGRVVRRLVGRFPDDLKTVVDRFATGFCRSQDVSS
jgi:hypothetical protein